MTDVKNLKPQVACIVLNWNGFDLTCDCVKSLEATSESNHVRRLVIVDNGSKDGSGVQLAQHFPHAVVIQLKSNRGIAAGYNAGIDLALRMSCEYALVLNNDLNFEKDSLDRLVDEASADPTIGIVMPKVMYFDPRNLIWSAGAFTRWFPGNHIMYGYRKLNTNQFSSSRDLAFAPSCCLLLTSKLCSQVRFDEKYFFYFDDWDFCILARGAGFRIRYCPESVIFHKVSRSTQESPKSLRWWKILGESCARYHKKHKKMSTLALYVAWVCLRETVKGNVRVLPVYVSGVLSMLKNPTRSSIPEWAN